MAPGNQPTDPFLSGHALAQALTMLGGAQSRADEDSVAVAALVRAVDLLSRPLPVKADGFDLALRVGTPLALAHANRWLGVAYACTDRLEDAVEPLRSVLTLTAALAESDASGSTPTFISRELPTLQAVATLTLGMVYAGLERYEEAEETLLLAAGDLQRLADMTPDEHGLAQQLIATLEMLAAIYVSSDRAEAAEATRDRIQVIRARWPEDGTGELVRA